ncbi:MAG: metallophosphoesterase, partial [Candidatus Eremiobacterota bacterium]
MRKLIKKEKMKKQLVIGDIHGCYKEFQALLEVSCLTKEDEIIALGDIVDRGPASPEILNFFRNNAGARVIKGNHERKHIRSFQGKTKAALSQQITRSQIGEKDYSNAISFMDSFVNFIELPEVILTHGFFEPGIPLSFQKEMVINGTMSGDVYLRENYKRPWYELYDGDKPVIVGHLNYSGTDNPFIYKDRVFCIDTGCCRGGKLTGVLLPEFKIVSVKSEKDYWKEIK